MEFDIRADPRTQPVPGQSRRGRVGLAMLTLGGAVVLGAGWLAVTGLVARDQLDSARAEVAQLRAQVAAGDLDAARESAESFTGHAGWARRLTSGPVWALAARLPGGGEPVRTVRGVTAAVDRLAREAVTPLIAASERLDPAELRLPGGGFDLPRLASVAPALATASAAVARALADVRALPQRTWLGSVDAARADMLLELTPVAAAARTAGLAARLVPPMLGQDGPKTYFLVFQNNAESRGTGGLPGAFAIVTAKGGKLTFSKFGTDRMLEGVTAQVKFGRDYDDLYRGAATTTDFRNANLSPHFPYAAQIWASMWEKHSGARVDGVLALDPAVLSYLLDVTGPATLPDKTKVGSHNVIPLTQSTAYALFPNDNAARQRYLIKIARAASARIAGAHGDTEALVRAAARAVHERRLLVWSADPARQADLERTAVSGIVPKTAARYAGLSIVNEAGSKLDYYLDRSLTWRSTGCGTAAKVTVTIALTNNAPRKGLPAETVALRNDAPDYPVEAGDNRLTVAYLATAGSSMTSVELDGKAVGAGVGAQRGHPVYTVDVELPRGTTRTVVLTLNEPGSGVPTVLEQPLVRPMKVTTLASDSVCRPAVAANRPSVSPPAEPRRRP